LRTGGHRSIVQTGTIILDITAPLITITSHTSGFTTTGSSIILMGTLVEANHHTLFINGSETTLAGNQRTKTLTLNTGANMIQVQATDLAGNTSATSITITRTIPPVITPPPAPTVPASGGGGG
jgi:hypothetical protein